MRIISGIHKGRKINPGKLKSARPTTDFAREGLFNILRNKIDFEEIDVLDLYTGSGAVILEFLSRGAQKCVAVDSQAESVKFIAGVARDWELDNLRVVKSDTMKYLDSCTEKFDVIFADPPYKLEVFEALWQRIRKNGILRPEGLLIFEHHDKMDLSQSDGFQEQRSFGQVNFSIFSSL